MYQLLFSPQAKKEKVIKILRMWTHYD